MGQATGLREVYIIISTNLILRVVKLHEAGFEIFTFGGLVKSAPTSLLRCQLFSIVISVVSKICPEAATASLAFSKNSSIAALEEICAKTIQT